MKDLFALLFLAAAWFFGYRVMGRIDRYISGHVRNAGSAEREASADERHQAKRAFR